MRLIDADALKEKFPFSFEGTVRLDVVERNIDNAPTIEERKTGEWTEKHHAYNDEEPVIEEWQSCCCSVCGRYDTRPYSYYFSEPKYCSYCGAKME